MDNSRLGGRVVGVVPNTGDVDTVGVTMGRHGGSSGQGDAGNLGREGRHSEQSEVGLIEGASIDQLLERVDDRMSE